MLASGEGLGVGAVSGWAARSDAPEQEVVSFVCEGVVVVKMDGAIADLGDRITHREIYDRLHGAIDAGTRYFVLDLLGVPFLDSAVLGLLVGLAKRVRGEGGSVCVAGAGPSARRAFEITGLSRIFGMAPTVQAALDSLPKRRS